MVTDDLTTLMRSAEAAPAAGVPDLPDVRRRGRRRRTVRRAASLGGATLALLVVAGTATTVLRGGGFDADRTIAPAGQDHVVTALTDYEHRVLREVPGSYAVDGTVVVPSPVSVEWLGQRLAPDRIVAPVRSLGFRGYASLDYLDTGNDDFPAFMQRRQPHDAQLVADNGPLSLTCTTWPEHDGCTVSVVARNADGDLYYDYGLGSDGFLKPFHDIQVFTGEDFSDRVYSDTVIGGLNGTDTTRVELTLVDGDTVDATLDRGTIHQGDTMFWAKTPAAVATVTAYDADGDVVKQHQVRACSGGVDCEVR